jgi:hypothetical protein
MAAAVARGGRPSTYGLDNTCTMGVAAFRARRAVVVVDDKTPDSELKNACTTAGRGAFASTCSGRIALGPARADGEARGGIGWHIQLQLDGRTCPTTRRLRHACQLVIDHNGKFLEPVGPEHPGMQSLLDLLDTGASGSSCQRPTRHRRPAPGYDDVGAIAKALVKAAPERCRGRATGRIRPGDASTMRRCSTAARLGATSAYAARSSTTRRAFTASCKDGEYRRESTFGHTRALTREATRNRVVTGEMHGRLGRLPS